MPCTSAVRASGSTAMTPSSGRTSSPGAADFWRERNRFEVPFASLTGASGGIAAYSWRRRARRASYSATGSPATAGTLQRQVRCSSGAFGYTTGLEGAWHRGIRNVALALGVLIALASAAFYAFGVTLQAIEARETPGEESLKLSLL